MRSSLKILILGLACLATTSFADVNLGPFITTGYLEGFLYPPHNEYDPNPGMPFPNRPVARYGLDFYATLALAKFPRLYAYGDLQSYFGNSHPQTDYNYSAKPIVGIPTVGMAFKLNHHFDLGVATSTHVNYGGYTRGERLMWSAVTLKVHW